MSGYSKHTTVASDNIDNAKREIINRAARFRLARKDENNSLHVTYSPGSAKIRCHGHRKITEPGNYRLRKTSITNDQNNNECLVITPIKPKSNLTISDIAPPTGQFLSSSSLKNMIFLQQHFNKEELAILATGLTFPEELLDEPIEEKFEISARCGASRTKGTKTVMGIPAREAFVAIANRLRTDTLMSEEQKNLIIKFFELFDHSDPELNNIIPRAEWCHIQAVSLTDPGTDPNLYNNLVAATCFVNTIMTTFESVAKRFAREGHQVSLTVKYRCFKETRTLADTMYLVLEVDGCQYTLKINPFEVTSEQDLGSVYDANHLYQHIKQELNNTEAPSTIGRLVQRSSEDSDGTSGEDTIPNVGLSFYSLAVEEEIDGTMQSSTTFLERLNSSSSPCKETAATTDQEHTTNTHEFFIPLFSTQQSPLPLPFNKRARLLEKSDEEEEQIQENPPIKAFPPNPAV